MRQTPWRLWASSLAMLLSSCGGGGGGAAASNQAPVATIGAPADAQTFKAGDTIAFAGSATDTEDGALGVSRLAWWVDLHHDTHTHPLQLETPGGSGNVAIPTRGEASDSIFYRFHLRATDSAGLSTEVTRDVLPLKAQVTLATVPAGLKLRLDGQAVAAPHAFAGVVNLERDLWAPDQNLGGRHYRFTGWSDGAAAIHTVATPSADATYTATFTDDGPARNQAPLVTLQVQAQPGVGVPTTLAATAVDADPDGRIVRVEFFNAGSKIGEAIASPFELAWTPPALGLYSLSARATDDAGATTDSTPVDVNVGAQSAANLPRSVTLTSPAHLADNLGGVLALAASAIDPAQVATVEFEVDGAALSTDAQAPFTASLDTARYAAGQHVVRARGRNAAGAASAWSSALVRFGGGRTEAAGFTRNTAWIAGLASATAFAQMPDGRLLVAEQGGALRVVKNGALLATPFVQLTVDSSGERGLLGVAVDPAFASNGRVYLYYTTTSGGTHNRVSRFTASGDVAAAGSELVLADLPALSSATNHNGGAMHFGLDGKLYVAVGDNADSSNAPDLSKPLGKLLRLNADGSIPSDNPFFAAQSGLARAVWAYGLRNPFTFAVQPGSGRLHINDVGEGSWEEINVGMPGANYGWPFTEGPTNNAGITAPLFAYAHDDANPPGSGPGGFMTGFAIAGGAFYPGGGSFPAAFHGGYFFADFVRRSVAVLDLRSGNANAAYAFASLASDPVDMLVGADTALYVLTRSGITRISAP